MRRSGELVQWNDERGFGFIRDNDGKRYFIHITEIRRTETRPLPGLRMTFDPATGDDGRPVARSAVLMGVAPRPKREEPPPARSGSRLPGAVSRIAVAAAIILAAIAATQQRLAPTWVLIAYLVMGIVSMWRYWRDKRAAENGEWRTSENALQFVDLIGGIAGGLVAQALLRHKVRKPGFALVSWATAAIHLVGLALVIIGVWQLPGALWFR